MIFDNGEDATEVEVIDNSDKDTDANANENDEASIDNNKNNDNAPDLIECADNSDLDGDHDEDMTEAEENQVLEDIVNERRKSRPQSNINNRHRDKQYRQ